MDKYIEIKMKNDSGRFLKGEEGHIIDFANNNSYIYAIVIIGDKIDDVPFSNLIISNPISKNENLV